jgi:hypothetical protein
MGRPTLERLMTKPWIQQAVRRPGALRAWLETNAHDPPWGLRSWKRPDRNRPLDMRLINRLIRDLDQIRAVRGGLDRHQRLAYRRLTLARTLKTMHGPLEPWARPYKQDPPMPMSISRARQIYGAVPTGILRAAVPRTPSPATMTLRLPDGGPTGLESSWKNAFDEFRGGAPQGPSMLKYAAIGGLAGLGFAMLVMKRLRFIPPIAGAVGGVVVARARGASFTK